MKKIGFVLILLTLPFASGCMPPPEARPGGPMGPGEFLFNTVWFFLVGLAVYYMLVLRPGFQKEDKHKNFLKELKKNDEVITTGGIFGRVFSVKPEWIAIEVSQNVKLRVKPEYVLPANGLEGPQKKPEEENNQKKGKKK